MPLSYSIIEVPFHLGLEDIAVGKGPGRLLSAGVDQILGHKGMPATVTHVRPRDFVREGQDSLADINRLLRHAVQEAVEQETIPVVLAGNCNSCVGTIAGLNTDRLGIVWFDRHPDFHTPETSISGNIEGMALAMAVGQCQQDFLDRVGLSRPVEERNVVLGCFWDVETGERERLQDSWVSAHAVDSLGLLPVALDQLKERVDAIYFHIDADFVVGVEMPANFVSLVRETIPIAAIGITNYNPDIDENGEWLEEILKVVRALQPGGVQ